MSITALVPLADSGITIGDHVTRVWHGHTFNLDTIWSTLIAGVLVLLLGLVALRYLTRNPEDHVPSKTQLLWETIVGQVNTQVEDNLGSVQPYVAPLAISLFFFILIANWLELLPTTLNDTTHLTPAPTADTNLTYAMALLVFFSTWAYGIRRRGLRGYFGGFLAVKVADNKAVDVPARAFFTLLNVLEELIKPVTLALRLFGNIFAGGIMIALIGLLPVYVLWAPNLVWKLFDMAIGGIQAFIFALLTVLYFAMAAEGHGGGEHDEHHELDADEVAEAAHQMATARVPEPVA